MEGLVSVAGRSHQAVGPPGSQLKRHSPMKTNHGWKTGKRPTAAQRRAWASFGGASYGWGQVTDEQYRAWAEAARQEKRRRRWPQGRRLTPQNLYTEINSNRAFIGLPPVLDPPEPPAFSLNPVGRLTISDIGGEIRLTLSVPKVPAEHILVFGSPPCSPGRRVWRDFRFLGLLPAPEGGESDITELYVKKFGSLPPGARVFIRTWQQVNGWRHAFPAQTTAVVPARPDAESPSSHRRASKGTREV
jgi:hypothetical protein